jgi:predicted dithiol-disulfide oxidoreductase (DUF899 family)
MAIPLGVVASSDLNFDYYVSFTPDQLSTDEVYHNYQMIPAPSRSYLA